MTCFYCKEMELMDRDVVVKTCNGCGYVRYCSKDCQRNDWPEHKQYCKEVEHCKGCNHPDLKSNLLHCSACKGAYYCSKDCQVFDWKVLGLKERCAAIKQAGGQEQEDKK